MRRRLELVALFAAAALLAARPPQAAIAADCPLDLSWPNYGLIASVCSDQNGHSKCCRYINAVLAVSSAMYANTTGTLGVPDEFSDACIANISDTLVSKGILPTAASFCGLGIKIQVSYQCVGMTTIVQMLQSPNFSDVTRSCATTLSDDITCKRCLNSGLSYLRHLVGEQDNVTLNTCRDAAFVAFVSQGNISTVDSAGCFFSVQGLSALQANISGPAPDGLLAPDISPSPLMVHVPVVPPKHHHSYKLVLFPAIGALVTGLAILLVIILILLIRRKNKELKKIEGNNPLDAWSFSAVKKRQEGNSTIFGRFSYREMKKATRNFSTVLGGENGTVFRGQLPDGSVVAIRRIDSSPKQSQQEFCKEMEFLGRLHHRHLVGLRGFCLTRFERFQVHEYMENGSLQDHLHSPSKHLLPWKNRIQIAIDVANALEYLHFYCDPPLYHGDVKPSNVFLDKNYLAKLAGCSLGHRCPTSGNTTPSSTPVNVKIQATPGYVDPEYAVTQEVTPKSDVYGYGVLLLELVTGKPVVQGERSLVEWSRELIGTDCRLHELVDPAVAGAFDLDELQVVADVIHWCTHRDGAARPSMKQVLRILHERLDPLSGRFARAVEGEEGYYYCAGGGGGRAKGKRAGGGGGEAAIQFGGEAARSWLPSSSSTSRSHCSRSVLLECSSPEQQLSPPPAYGNGAFPA
ncbi:hypothetical protein GQ55_7G141700 [Panicum hallii var. hallii]|uniref:Protein kinase domain-containing protein n=2 Tax=Panicum hallii var. hallii TaxID=1504633 RepID=A0A2T7CUZ8_9POAL|nr:hypothetical protein GQ55_7G141700 [Panicum hallii var. hallii]